MLLLCFILSVANVASVLCILSPMFLFCFLFLFIPLFLAEVGRWHCFQDRLFVKMSFLTLLGRSTTWAKRTRDSHHAEPHCCQPIFIYAYFCFYFSKMFLKCQPIVHVEYKISANVLGVKLPLWSRWAVSNKYSFSVWCGNLVVVTVTFIRLKRKKTKQTTLELQFLLVASDLK